MIFQRFFLDNSCLASNWFRNKIAIATKVSHNVHGSNDITERREQRQQERAAAGAPAARATVATAPLRTLRVFAMDQLIDKETSKSKKNCKAIVFVYLHFEIVIILIIDIDVKSIVTNNVRTTGCKVRMLCQNP